MLRVSLAVGVLLAATYLSLPDETHSLGMWGDFSMHAQRARALAAKSESGVEESSPKVNCTQILDQKRVRSRKKRYVTFPSGSSSSLALCLSLGVPDTNQIFTHGFGYGISFELPNDTKILRGGGGGRDEFSSREMGIHYLDWNENFPAKRRDRRSLYGRMEYALEQFGLDGRSCILRTLCEAAQQLAPKGSFLKEFIRIIFTMPQLERPHSWEGWDWDQEESKDYDEAHLKGRSNPHIDCSNHFPGCSISLLQFLIS